MELKKRVYEWLKIHTQTDFMLGDVEVLTIENGIHDGFEWRNLVIQIECVKTIDTTILSSMQHILTVTVDENKETIVGHKTYYADILYDFIENGFGKFFSNLARNRMLSNYKNIDIDFWTFFIDRFCSSNDSPANQLRRIAPSFQMYFQVREVTIEESTSTRRRDTSFTTKEYQLTYNGIPVMDDYLRSIMPYKVDMNSEYNDSTPGAIGSYSSYKFSDYGLEYFRSVYDVEDHLAFISKSYDIGVDEKPKCEYQEAYHEMGHFFGFVLSDSLGHPIGTILSVNLTSKNPSIFIRKPLYTLPQYYDRHDAEKLIATIKTNLNEDRTRTLLYFTYIMMGAVFNLVYKIESPERWDVDKIYEDNEEGIKLGKIDGRAGNDFTKIKGLEDDLNWGGFSFDNFRDMTYDLVKIVKECNLIRYKHYTNRCSFQYIIDEYIGEKVTDKEEIAEIYGKISRLSSATKFVSLFKPILKKYSKLIDGTTEINDVELFK